MGVTHTKINGIAAWTQTDVNAQIAAGNLPPGTTLSQVVTSADWNATHTVSTNAGDATNITGLLKGNGSTLSAAASGTDFQAPITLTTTGSSGAATFTSNTLNIPQYTGGGTTINTTQVDQTPSGGTYGTLAGAVNGSNTVYTVSNAAYVSGTLIVSLNGQNQTQGNDWSETSSASGTFTFANAPPTGAIIQVEYIKTANTAGTGNGPIILASVAGINAKTVANTAIYTVPAGKTAIITGAVITCTAAASISAGPSLGVGNSAGSNNIFASATLTALTTTTACFGFVLSGMSVTTAAAAQIFLNLGTAATGTSQTIAIDLIGYVK